MGRLNAGERRLVVGVGGCVAVAIVVYGGIFLRANDFFRPSGRDALVLREQERSLIQARKIKLGLRPWALQNSDLLKKMRASDGSDQALLETVWKRSPGTLLRGGDDANILYYAGTRVKYQDTNAPVGFELFAGQYQQDKQAVKLAVADPVAQDLQQKATESLYARRQFYWKKFHDLPYQIAITPGNTNVLVWLSGRITAETIPGSVGEAASKVKHFDSYVELCDEQEIESAFEFLQ